ncbi:MAG: hypothetical protein ACO3UU_06590, partial [Minisyncoccia bacterium]
MSINNFTEFNLPKNSYVSFDATTLKELIISRLNENEVFRDQNYEGSNINAFIDIVAYMYHVLLFYLNTTSSETTFTTATLYENINKLVSTLGYKPTGRQTSLVNVSLSASNQLPVNNYTLKRFSTIFTNGIPFIAIDDISFEKTINGSEELSVDNNLLYQGVVFEHPIYTAGGENYETITIVNRSPEDQLETFISDNTFRIFVKSYQTGKWEEWSETSSLFLEDSNSYVYEKRLNENSNYEFKFGNGITGKKLEEGDEVQIYYVISDGVKGTISARALLGNFFSLYNTQRFTTISADIYDPNTTFITPATLNFITTNNNNDSSPIAAAETVDQIKENAPRIFSIQNRLVTASDYEYFITKNYNNIIKSVKVLSNEDYINKGLKYYYSIGLNKPNEDCRVLFNQINYANSTSFNNVYITPVTKINPIINERAGNYLNPAQKQLIINECNIKKDITQSVVVLDPIFKAFSLGLQIEGEEECVDLKDVTNLVLIRDTNSRISKASLKNKAASIITDYFAKAVLGQTVSLSDISRDILNLDGVKSLATRRTDVDYEIPKLSVIVWNPLYEVDDITFTTQNVIMEDFQYPFFY